MKDRIDKMLFRLIQLHGALIRIRALSFIAVATEPLVSRVFVGWLERQAAQLERSAKEVADLDPELAGELRQSAAEYRNHAHQLR
ncbi:hypothetical protein [Kitasatospora sp. NPDC051705]|uniref:hypothetical protein n=1 Tax=Kitasatospora sp. NPDC051705 TaxID=3364057 RepID=UPI0037A0F1ED